MRWPRPSSWGRWSTGSPRRSPAPDHAGLRQHPPHVRAAGPPPGRAPRHRARGRPSRQPVQGATAPGRGAAPRRRAPGAGGHRLARAGHRHRPDRAGVPGRDRPAASPPSSSGSGGPTTRSAAFPRRSSTPCHATSWSSALPCWRRYVPGSSTRPSSPVAPFDILAQQVVAEVAGGGGVGGGRVCSSCAARPPPMPGWFETTSTPWSRWCPRGSPPVAADGWRICTGTGSTACSGHGAAPGSPL